MTRSDSQDEATGGGDSAAPPTGSSAALPTGYSEAVAAREGDGEGAAAAAAVKGEFFVVDVDWEAEEAERVCRICHLSSEKDGSEEESELIQLGCGCKGELGFGHRHCAETWFRVKGNRSCEICGMNAKNIIGEEGITVEWHDGRTLGGSNNNRSAPERDSCWKSQPFCNFLMACLVVAFIFPWFFRVNIF